MANENGKCNGRRRKVSPRRAAHQTAEDFLRRRWNQCSALQQYETVAEEKEEIRQVLKK